MTDKDINEWIELESFSDYTFLSVNYTGLIELKEIAVAEISALSKEKNVVGFIVTRELLSKVIDGRSVDPVGADKAVQGVLGFAGDKVVLTDMYAHPENRIKRGLYAVLVKKKE